MPGVSRSLYFPRKDWWIQHTDLAVLVYFSFIGLFFIIVEENNIDGKKIRKVYARHIKLRCSCFANCFFSCLLIDNGVFDIEPQKNRKKLLPALANLLKEIISSFQFVSIPLINPSFLPSLTLPSCYLRSMVFHPRQG